MRICRQWLAQHIRRSCLRPTAEDVSAFGQLQNLPPDARKTFGTQDTQSAAQYIKHYSCFIYLPSMSDIEEISAKE